MNHNPYGTYPTLAHHDGAAIPLTRQGNTFYLACRLGWLGKSSWKMVAVADEVQDSGTASSSTAPAPSAESGALIATPLSPELPAPTGKEEVPLETAMEISERPALSCGSSVVALKARLKVLKGPVYGTKGELWRRLCEYEARAEQRTRERQWIEARKEEMIKGMLPVAPEMPDAPVAPEDPAEIERHEATHIPPAPLCLACRLGKGREAAHARAIVPREAAQVQIDFSFLKENAEPYPHDEGPENHGLQSCAR